MPEEKPQPPSASPRRVTLTLDIGRPWVVVMWALFIFLMGAVTGVGIHHLMRPGPPRGHGAADSALPEDFSRRMQRDYRLTNEQTAEIERIVAKYQPRFEKTSRQAHEQLQSDMEEMNMEILPVLTAEQADQHLARWRDVVRPRPEHRRRHDPPPRREPPPRRN